MPQTYLTPYNKTESFNDLQDEDFLENVVEEAENVAKQHCLLFPLCFWSMKHKSMHKSKI